MSRLSPQEAADKWGRRLKGATPDIQSGINRVTEAPGVKAAAKQEKMLQNVTEAVSSGKWGRRVASVTLEDWKNKALTKGVPRISAGVDGAAGKQTDFFGQLLPFQDNLRGQIARMPDLTIEDNINRMTTFIRGMSGFTKK